MPCPLPKLLHRACTVSLPLSESGWPTARLLRDTRTHRHRQGVYDVADSKTTSGPSLLNFTLGTNTPQSVFFPGEGTRSNRDVLCVCVRAWRVGCVCARVRVCVLCACVYVCACVRCVCARRAVRVCASCARVCVVCVSFFSFAPLSCGVFLSEFGVRS